jgi:hypothetical protein
MTDIKQYLPYCKDKEATVKKAPNHSGFAKVGDTIIVSGLTLDLCDSDDFEIIPHMRKIESLTEEEMLKIFEMIHVQIYHNMQGDMRVIYFKQNKDEGVGLQVRWDELDVTYGMTVEERGIEFSCNGQKLIVRQFPIIHYLTSIGIAWWATEDMWESGALIESNQEQK